jgi:hypothetical protein
VDLREPLRDAQGDASRTHQPRLGVHHASCSRDRSPAPTPRAPRAQRSPSQRHWRLKGRRDRGGSQAVLAVKSQQNERRPNRGVKSNDSVDAQLQSWTVGPSVVPIGHGGARTAGASWRLLQPLSQGCQPPEWSPAEAALREARARAARRRAYTLYSCDLNVRCPIASGASAIFRMLPQVCL